MFTKEEINEIIQDKIISAEKEYGKKVKLLIIELLALQGSLQEKVEESQLIPVAKWNDHHSYPTVSALRMIIFNAAKNGFDKVIVRKGKRVFIDEQAFFNWQRSA